MNKKVKLNSIVEVEGGFNTTIKLKVLRKDKYSFQGRIIDPDSDFNDKVIDINYNKIKEKVK